MYKHLLLLLTVLSMSACTTTDILSGILKEYGLAPSEIAAGLKEALRIGIGKGADILSERDGFYKSTYKILLPPEARKITDKLQNVPGFNRVEEVILEKINRGAEDAAAKAKPIFLDAIQQMTFADARDILMGNDDAATSYLRRTTFDKLYVEFNPVIVNSLDKFEARKYWSDAVNAYNRLPFVEKANPDLDDYVTQQALTGLFSMVENEEKDIRNNIAARTTDLLRRVFAAQDNK